jgi:pyruvate,water dikinase
MGGFWRRVRGHLPGPRMRGHVVDVARKLAALRTIGAANDEFLTALARYQELADSGAMLCMGVVTEAYESLSSPVGTMAHALATMGGEAYAELVQRYEALDRELVHQALRERPLEFGPLVLWPTDPAAHRPELVGPKAARLAQLAGDGGYDVPPFFCVTVHAYHLFMEASGAYDEVQRFLPALNPSDEGALRAFSTRVAATIAAAALPSRLEASIGEALERLAVGSGTPVRVAVRSSAVVEDAESSFAGQFESVLNVAATGVAAAYKRVIASKYAPPALRYAHARGYLDADVAMPVLIMAMVEPQASGVAYSRSLDRPDRILVSAVAGLAQPVVDGHVVPDRFVIADGAPAQVKEALRGRQAMTLRCAADGGVQETPTTAEPKPELVLDDVGASRVAMLSRSLEKRFGEPQDIEWALDNANVLWVVQTRPLLLAPPSVEPTSDGVVLAGRRVLVHGGSGASGGVACGPIALRADLASLGELPIGCILVVPTTSPRLAGVMGTVAGLVTVAGSATGHMATVAREFGVPCLVGADHAMELLTDGQVVTLDASSGKIYEGEVPELLATTRANVAASRNPLCESLRHLVDGVARLTLTDPDSDAFDAAHCTTLHDVARFAHQKAMAEMFATDTLAPHERRACRRLAWPRPMEIRVLDLGGGVTPTAGRQVSPEEIASAPLQALIEGMMDSRLRWAGPVGFDLRGFVSLAARSAADDQRYGEPSYALCSRDYLHFASRLAYHFALADSICGESVNENYVRFRFHGGAATVERREWRAHFLATVLRRNSFTVAQVGDRVDATLAKRPAAEIEDAMVMLGRLMVASRHLDMVVESPAVAAALARAFLTGDYSFDRVRTQGGP